MAYFVGVECGKLENETGTEKKGENAELKCKDKQNSI